MTSHIAYQTPAGHNGPIRILLFEDDHDVYRILIAFFTVHGPSNKFQRGGLYIGSILAFGILLALLAELGGRQGLNGSDVDRARYDFGGFFWQEPSPAFTDGGQESDSEGDLGPFANGAVDPNYFFGFISYSSAESQSNRNSTDSPAMVLALNSATTESGASQGQSDLNGAGAVAKPESAAQPKVATVVPETGSSISLLGASLLLIGFVRLLLLKRWTPKIPT